MSHRGGYGRLYRVQGPDLAAMVDREELHGTLDGVTDICTYFGFGNKEMVV